MYKELKLIEAWGSGIQKMHDQLADYSEIGLKLHEAGHAFQAQFIQMDAKRAGSKLDEGRVRAESGQSPSQRRFKPLQTI